MCTYRVFLSILFDQLTCPYKKTICVCVLLACFMYVMCVCYLHVLCMLCVCVSLACFMYVMCVLLACFMYFCELYVLLCFLAGYILPTFPLWVILRDELDQALSHLRQACTSTDTSVVNAEIFSVGTNFNGKATPTKIKPMKICSD